MLTISAAYAEAGQGLQREKATETVLCHNNGISHVPDSLGAYLTSSGFKLHSPT